MATDIYYLIEMLFLVGLPFALIAVGIILRKKFKPVLQTEAGIPVERTAGQKTGRIFGNILLWAGILSVFFCGIVVLNFMGVI